MRTLEQRVVDIAHEVFAPHQIFKPAPGQHLFVAARIGAGFNVGIGMWEISEWQSDAQIKEVIRNRVEEIEDRRRNGR